MRWQILLLLVVIEIAYLAAGGGIFYALEYRSAQSQEQEAEKSANHSDITVILREFIDNGSYGNLSVDDLSSLFTELTYIQQQLSYDQQAANNWNYPGSVFFAMTVVTTIGYGNIYPTNNGSRTFCCFYALVGIPLTLVMLLGVGEKLKSLAERLDQRVTRKRPRIGKIGRALYLLLLGFGLFVLLPSGIFTVIQGWSFGISIYYSIVSLSTIGFGDYVAGFTCPGSYCALYRLSVGIWIFIGLAWLAGLISSIQDLFHEAVVKVDENPIKDKIKDKIEQRRTGSYVTTEAIIKKSSIDSIKDQEEIVISDQEDYFKSQNQACDLMMVEIQTHSLNPDQKCNPMLNQNLQSDQKLSLDQTGDERLDSAALAQKRESKLEEEGCKSLEGICRENNSMDLDLITNKSKKSEKGESQIKYKISDARQESIDL